MRFNKYWPFAFIYFFINSLGLPFGLTYTALLGPFFYGWVLLHRKKEIFLPFFAILAPFILMQVFVYGVDLPSYLVSLVNMTMIYFFGQAVYTWLIESGDHELIFQRLLVVNIVFCIVALIFYFTPYADLFWIRQNLTKGIDQFMRLKLFTYEASYYAQLFVPVFLFFLFQYLLAKNRINNYLLIPMLLIPLVLSFSLGVMGCLLFALGITFIVHFPSLATKRRVVNSVISLVAVACITGFIVIFFFRDNAFFMRVGNIILGQDSSGEGRTRNAFYLASRILSEKNEIWGIGPGQLKIIGQDIIRAYYLYYDQTPVAIPNATAETLMVFGWAGLALRFFIEIFLFIQARVWKNYYRLALFLFMFAYQFTGSYLTNVAEYMIWIMAFTPVFKEFNVKRPVSFSRLTPGFHKHPGPVGDHIPS